MARLRLFLIGLFATTSIALQAQDAPKPRWQFQNGIGVTVPDSSFAINFRFRMQNRIGFTLTDNDTAWNPSAVEFRTRRVRLRLDGFVFNKRWQYALQLSFSRGDQDWDNAGVPNILRDAMLFYEVNKDLRIGFGQGKLPGNRQRVVSSGEQQFVDRSNVNATFNIDRDFGVQIYYHTHTGNVHYNLRGALSSGEGRNEGVSQSHVKANPGLCYTGRFEFLPLGLFDGKSDYFEADLAREKKPKLSIGGTWSFNDDAVRTGGQLGKSLYAKRDITTILLDGLFKYKGLSVYGEYIRRFVNAGTPVTMGEESAEYVYDGEGILVQSGYVLPSNFEFVARYAQVMPLGDTRDYRPLVNDYTIGLNKYLKNHKLKLQFDATLQQTHEAWTNKYIGQNLQFRFQVEMGI